MRAKAPARGPDRPSLFPLPKLFTPSPDIPVAREFVPNKPSARNERQEFASAGNLVAVSDPSKREARLFRERLVSGCFSKRHFALRVKRSSCTDVRGAARAC